MKKLCFVLTAEFAVRAFLLNHLRALSKIYDVTVVVNTNNPNFLIQHGINAKVVPLPISRNISLISDLNCLLKLTKLFYIENFSAVNSITPKAGLLAMLAAFICRAPLRVHTFTGQVWANKKGYKKFLLKNLDCLTALLATHNIVDSSSQRQFLLDQKIINTSKSLVFAKGSISGVEIERFKPNSQVKANFRRNLNISPDTILFLFIGRLTIDKGVLDLARAFLSLKKGCAHLLFVGPDEQDLEVEIIRIVGKDNPYVHFVGHTDTPELYMATADVLCLPSYREGFGTVVIEAASVGIPAIVSRIYGLLDAVVDGETGLLHEPHDIADIKDSMQQMITNKILRVKLGEQARARAIKDFDSQLITCSWVDFYSANVG